MRANMITLALAFTFSIFSTPTSANASPSKTYRIAVYRGDAGCAGCSEMVVKSLVGTGLPLNIAYVGEKETLKVNEQTLNSTAGFSCVSEGFAKDFKRNLIYFIKKSGSFFF